MWTAYTNVERLKETAVVEKFELDGINYQTYSLPCSVMNEQSTRFYLDREDADGNKMPHGSMNRSQWGLFSFKEGAAEGEASAFGCSCYDCTVLASVHQDTYNAQWASWRASTEAFMRLHESRLAEALGREVNPDDCQWHPEYVF